MRSDFARLLEAIDFAAKKHRNQRRKDHDASPYINHPLGLAALLAKEGSVDDVEVLQATVGNQEVIGPWRGEAQVCAGQQPVAI